MQHFDDHGGAVGSGRGRWSVRLALAILATLSLAVAACGSSDTSSDTGSATAAPASTAAEAPATDAAATDAAASDDAASGDAASGLEKAKQLVAEAEGTAEWKGPDDPIDVSSLKGKTIWAINLDLAIPHMNKLSEVMKEAAAKAGVKVMIFDGKSQVSEWARGVEQAISAKADAIVPLTISLDTIMGPLQKAKKAGIPIVAGNYSDADEGMPPEYKDLLAGMMGEKLVKTGQLEAAWTIADSEGKANVLAIDVPGAPTSPPVVKGIKTTFAELCPDCTVTWKQATTAQWSTQLATMVRSTLTSNPKIDYIIPLYDGMATFIAPAVHQAGAADRVKISSFNATASIMEMLKRGDVIGADVGTPAPWEGWALADASFRAILGEPGVENYEIPVRLFTQENIGEIDLAQSAADWYGDVDYESKYLTTWGLK